MSASWLDRRRRRERTHAGIAISERVVTTVLWSRGQLAWAATFKRDADQDLESALGHVLAALAAVWGRRPLPPIAFVTSDAQVKLIADLPATDDRTYLRVLQSNANRYFIASIAPPLFGGVRRIGSAVLVAAYPTAVVAAIRSVTEPMGARRVRLVPTVAVLGGTRDSEIEYTDAGTVISARYCRGELTHLARRVAGAHELNEDIHLAAAIGAATCGFNERIGIDLRSTRPRRWRLLSVAVAAPAASLMVLLAWAGPVANDAFQRRTLLDSLRTLAPVRARSASDLAELSFSEQGLGELESYERPRLSPTRVLNQLSDALLPASAIVSLDVDTLGGSVTVVGPQAAEVVAALDHVSALTAPVLVGPVLPEAAGAPTSVTATPGLERVTVQFRLVPHRP